MGSCCTSKQEDSETTHLLDNQDAAREKRIDSDISEIRGSLSEISEVSLTSNIKRHLSKQKKPNIDNPSDTDTTEHNEEDDNKTVPPNKIWINLVRCILNRKGNY